VAQVSEKDRIRWDAAYTDDGPHDDEPALPQVFSGHADLFPVTGSALDVACGTGRAAVWLGRRGLEVSGLDVSAVAVNRARQSAVRHGVAERCRFDVADLDGGLPPGPPVDVVLCHRFRDPGLYPALAGRLGPGGLLAICVLSEVGADPGRFRAAAGELEAAFTGLETLAAGEGDGQAWLVARAPATGRR
jgi:SAM-dependent methyltransferase